MHSEYQKYFSDGFTLDTSRISLRIMTPDDYDTLARLASSPEIFTWFTKDLSQPGELKIWMDTAFAERREGKRVPFVITDNDTREICGCTSYGNISFYDKRLEIGWTWLGTEYIGMGVNTPTKFALLSFAFEAMKMERVEIKTDQLNERAKAAILKIGMIPEGILRSHMQMHSNRRRDTAYYGLLRTEWPERRDSFFVNLI